MQITSEIAPNFGRIAGMDKIQKFGWTLADGPGKLLLIDKKRLKVDTDYQRAGNAAKVAAIARDWSWMACGTLIVGYREGEYWVIDGQHRALAALSRSDIANLPCVVFETSDTVEEATGFLRANTLRKPLSYTDRFKALTVAGDPDAIYVQKMMDLLSIRVATGGQGHGRRTKALGTFMKIASTDRDTFDKVIKVCAELCPNAPMSERLLLGLEQLQNSAKLLDQEKFTHRLVHIGREKVEGGIFRAVTFYQKAGQRIYGIGILEAVNKGLRNPFTADERGI